MSSGLISCDSLSDWSSAVISSSSLSHLRSSSSQEAFSLSIKFIIASSFDFPCFNSFSVLLSDFCKKEKGNKRTLSVSTSLLD